MKRKRAFGVLAATFVAAALPMVAASPASASSADCQVYLRNLGYNVGPRVQDACNAAAAWDLSGMNRHACYVTLANLGVKVRDANTACYQLA
ncbi:MULTISPECIES: hypothetical protein [unclassified Streptomyces]|uniref:hypothetical protein n=1 Tax=unclassified Streptomyces TaxID=2593676 RepID=UPI002E111DA4|nr:hypothetical protein OG457_29645 [Streptomyces sp. NBC_01207]WTA20766.1 hypothetical protein OG365_23530 [Streptomyces sp. NBC_00853]